MFLYALYHIDIKVQFVFVEFQFIKYSPNVFNVNEVPYIRIKKKKHIYKNIFLKKVALELKVKLN